MSARGFTPQWGGRILGRTASGLLSAYGMSTGHKLEPLLQREPQLPVADWPVGVSVRRAQSTVGSDTPRQVVLHYIRKQAEQAGGAGQ